MKETTEEKIANIIAALIVLAIGLVIVGVITALLTMSWDNKTGQDTGYISAVDNRTFGDDKTLYLRRHPLNAQMTFGSTEEDEYTYCIKGDNQAIIDKAYEAITTGKRVKVIYSEKLPFAFRSWWECRTAPITDIQVIEEDS